MGTSEFEHGVRHLYVTLKGKIPADVAYSLTIDWAVVRRQVKKAVRSRRNRSTAGALTVQVIAISGRPDAS